MLVDEGFVLLGWEINLVKQAVSVLAKPIVKAQPVFFPYSKPYSKRQPIEPILRIK